MLLSVSLVKKAYGEGERRMKMDKLVREKVLELCKTALEGEIDEAKADIISHTIDIFEGLSYQGPKLSKRRIIVIKIVSSVNMEGEMSDGSSTPIREGVNNPKQD